jgi:hypothetical protein
VLIGAPLAARLGLFPGDRVSFLLPRARADSVQPLLVSSEVRGLFRFGAERPSAVRLIAQLDSTPLPANLRSETRRLQQQSMGSIAWSFDRAIRRGELPAVDPAYCAAAYVALVMFQMSARAGSPGESTLDPETAARQLTSYIVAGSHGAPPILPPSERP